MKGINRMGGSTKMLGEGIDSGGLKRQEREERERDGEGECKG